MEDKRLPMLQIPPLHTEDESKGTANCYILGTNSVAGVAGTLLRSASNRLRDSISGFFLRVYSHRVVEVFGVRVFLL